MIPVEYTFVTDPQLQSRVRTRYARDIESLSKFGFRQLCYYSEQLKPYSSVLQLPMLLLMLGHREVISIQSPLRISLGFILLYHTEPPTIALPMGMGIKLYTDFADRSLLITGTFSNLAAPRQSPLVRKIASTKGLDATWRLHQAEVRRLENLGKFILPQVSFNSYVDMSRREEVTF